MFITAFPKPKKPTQNAPNKDINEKLSDILQLNCHICASPYNSVDKIPTIICSQQHTYCLMCVNQLFEHRKNAQRCPSCRAFICKNFAYTNKTLLRICDLIPNLAVQFNNLSTQITSLKENCNRLQEVLNKQGKENRNQVNGKQGLQEHFPPLKELDAFKNKHAKINIRGFLAQRRVSTNKLAKKEEDKHSDPRKKMKSTNN